MVRISSSSLLIAILYCRTVISKPKEIASYLMKQKFGSADNIPHVITREPDGTHSAGVYHGSANIPATAEIRLLNNY